MKRALAFMIPVLWGCGEANPALRPVIQAAPEGTEADPYRDLDSVQLAVARAGLESNLVESDATLLLSDVPFGRDLVLHLSGIGRGNQVSYGRSCNFDFEAGGADLQLALYFSRLSTWATAPEPTSGARQGALGWSDGRGGAVFAGGGVSSMERFDPNAGEFSALGELPDREGATLAALPDGRAILVGGEREGALVPEILGVDPSSGTVLSQTGPAVVGHASAALVDGMVLSCGGEREGVVSSAAFLVGFEGSNLSDVPELGSMQFARASHTATRMFDELGAAVLVVGGTGDDGLPVANAELYRPLSEQFVPLPGAILEEPRFEHSAVRLPGGFVLIIGGFVSPGVAARKLEVYDPLLGEFITASRELAAGEPVTGFSVTTLPDGRILLAGGTDENGTRLQGAFIVSRDPFTGGLDLTTTDSLDTPRSGHAAASLCDGTVLVVGGAADGAPGAERYNPSVIGRR